METTEHQLRQEHARYTGIWQRNLDKRFDPNTKPCSRFAYASHVTKAASNLERIERDMRRWGFAIPTYDE